MRRLFVAFALTSILAGIGAAYALASTKGVRVGDNFFSRSSITIKRGTALNWHWRRTQNFHNVTAIKGGRFHSTTGKTVSYTHVFRSRGTVTIVCTLHPRVMRLKVKVV
jgi:plastocyanin